MNTLSTMYGDILITGHADYSREGALLACTPAGETVLETTLGKLIPQYTANDLRRKTVHGINFHKNGMIKSLSLESCTVVSTPAGAMPAEQVTFHENGNVSRVFPLNGKLSGYWSQEDEAALADPIVLVTPIGVLRAKLLSVSFCEKGFLKSFTLWPEELLSVPTPTGKIETRIGVSFWPNGAIRSLEPATPHRVETHVGMVQAFDPDAIGINADTNSLGFTIQGKIQRVTTTLTCLTVDKADKGIDVFVPGTRESWCSDADLEPVPMILEFAEEHVDILCSINGTDSVRTRILYKDGRFSTSPHHPGFGMGIDQMAGKMGCSI